ncbi:MAG TPA: hypothetical protein PLS50_00620 [Candidatus Dojkabacteria bacterium]|nr:hypothetical protein [Candidatus Dojkabacteria bacterium]
MRTRTREIWYSEWMGGYVIKDTIIHTDGAFKGKYVDFPESEYGVLDSMTVTAYKTRKEAEEALNRLGKYE